jgi:hypothetical protein
MRKNIVALEACLLIFKAFLYDLDENQEKITSFQRAFLIKIFFSIKYTFTSELIQSKILQKLC